LYNDDIDKPLLELGNTFLDRLRAEHANALAHAERLANTIASVEQTLRMLSGAPIQQHIPLESFGGHEEQRNVPPIAVVTTRGSVTGNGWARRLQGLTQLEAIVQIAEDNDGIVRTKDVADILLRAGLSNADPRNLYRYVLHFLTTSGMFEKAGKGTYRLRTSQERFDSELTDWAELPSDEAENPRAQ
jgi:hypothetical protein